MIGRCSLFGVLSLALLSWAMGGCGGSSGPGGSGGEASAVSSSGRRYTADERKVEVAVMAEIRKHCVQSSDGWTTALWEGTSFAPIYYLRQYKKLQVADVESAILSPSDKLNGFEWAGRVTFAATPIREVGGRSLVGGGNANVQVWRSQGRWSQWVSYTPLEIDVNRHHGKWQFSSGGMQTPLSGTIPTPTDFARVGMR